MRLTLRTLLSYLDDTLAPAQSRLIGEKVAESEIAPELIERIKKVTRRRGLAAPAATGDGGDSSADPNTVAEYLDNCLPAEQVAELEQTALDSDSALAEVSSCHQILTLVLGEPAKVPPTARQHMYHIVKGKDSVLYRRASTTANVAGIAAPPGANEDNAEADETLLLGLSGSRLLVPIATAGIITLLLLFVIWMAIPSSNPVADQRYISIAANPPKDTQAKAKSPGSEKPEPAKPDKNPKTNVEENPKVKGEEPPKKPEKEPVKVDVASKNNPELLTMPREIVVRALVTPPEKPSPERRAIARLESKNFLLLQRKRDTDDWERAAPDKELFSTDKLMSLPGFRNEIKLESGVRLLLYGSMPDYNGIEPLLESRVTLHAPPLGIDADFTLESGRVFITHAAPPGQKVEPMRVRVRFREEMWEVTLLDPETEVCFDLIGYYSEETPFSLEPNGPAPTTEVYFGLLRGRAGLKMKFKDCGVLQAPMRVFWNSASQDKTEPVPVTKQKDLESWSKSIIDDPFTKELQAAAIHYANRFNNPKPDEARMDVAFFSAIQDAREQPARRIFALRALQALGAIEYLADAFTDDVPPMRQAAIHCAQHWCGLAPERDLILYKVLVKQKSYKEAEATTTMQLLHPLERADYANRETVAALFEFMKHEKIIIRELAYKHMAYGDPKGAQEVGFFNAGDSNNVRDAIVQKWKASWKKRFIDKK